MLRIVLAGIMALAISAAPASAGRWEDGWTAHHGDINRPVKVREAKRLLATCRTANYRPRGQKVHPEGLRAAQPLAEICESWGLTFTEIGAEEGEVTRYVNRAISLNVRWLVRQHRYVAAVRLANANGYWVGQAIEQGEWRKVRQCAVSYRCVRCGCYRRYHRRGNFCTHCAAQFRWRLIQYPPPEPDQAPK